MDVETNAAINRLQAQLQQLQQRLAALERTSETRVKELEQRLTAEEPVEPAPETKR